MKQADALKAMLSSSNIFLTGPPGAGKTYVLNQFIEKMEEWGQSVAITASTGIAASHIGGITIHSWSGLGILDELSNEDLEKIKYNRRVVKRYKKVDVLVIDEVSMLHGYRLDMIDRVAREIRQSNKPFGGIQVILVGDLYQLPPVNRESEVLHFVHLSDAWKSLNLKICYLTEQHRQEGNDLLLDVLQAMRDNTVDESHLSILNGRATAYVADDNLTRLFSHNVDVDYINQKHLDALPGKIQKYNMHSDGDARRVDQLKRSVLAPETLELKVGAEVMFVANNFEVGFVNGTRGRVIKFKKRDPIIKLNSGRTIRVEQHTWKTKEDDVVVAKVEQLPLRLAWAITIHKSQGMSLDAAEVDLTKAFTPGMGYVALSRVRSLDGLYLKGFNEMALTMHAEIYDLDKELREASNNDAH